MPIMESSFSIESMIRGYHVYKDIWLASVGETVNCTAESSNLQDPFAVAVMKDHTVIGHLPRKISFACHLFLRRLRSIWCEVTGGRRHSEDLIQGGLEVPCIIFFRGSVKDVRKLKILVEHAMSYSCESESSNDTNSEPNNNSKHTGGKLDENDGEPEKKRLCSSGEWVRFKHTTLTFKERDIILDGQELSDLHIDFAQNILSAQYPNITGFQSTLFQLRQPLKSSSNVVQVLYVRNNHWIVLTSVNCQEGDRDLCFFLR